MKPTWDREVVAVQNDRKCRHCSGTMEPDRWTVRDNGFSCRCGHKVSASNKSFSCGCAGCEAEVEDEVQPPEDLD